MRKLSDLIMPDRIDLDLDASKKREAIARLSELVCRGTVMDPAGIAADLAAREELVSTGISHGAAIPHAQREDCPETIIAFARLKGGIDWKSVDGTPVSLIFTMVGPRNDSGLHLQLLSRLARLLSISSFREDLMNAADPAGVISAIAAREAER